MKKESPKLEAEALKDKSAELIEESVSANPGRMSEIAIELTSIKAYMSERLDNILVFKADELERLRSIHKTSAAANSAFKATKEGHNEIILRGIIGRIKDQISVIKLRLQVKKDESFGSY